MTLGALIDVAGHVGYVALFLLIMFEASGVPLPGETALVAGGVLASQGKLEIYYVIALAAAGAIIGDNLGYLVGRRGGRRLLERPGRFEKQRRRVLDTGEPFFAKHGPKAVFFGRWILGLRVWASWLAGITHMPWRSFVFWNAAGRDLVGGDSRLGRLLHRRSDRGDHQGCGVGRVGRRRGARRGVSAFAASAGALVRSPQSADPCGLRTADCGPRNQRAPAFT